MRASPTAAASAAPTALPFGIDTGLVNGMLQPPQQFAEMASSMGTEVLRFTSRRLRAQAEHLDALARCHTMQEMMDRQMEFLRRCGSEYTQELGAVLKLAQPKPAEPTKPARAAE